MKAILLLPWILLFTSIYFRLKDNSSNLIAGKLESNKKYTWSIPLRELSKLIDKNIVDPALKKDLEAAMKSRRLHYLFAMLTFLAVFIAGYLSRN